MARRFTDKVVHTVAARFNVAARLLVAGSRTLALLHREEETLRAVPYETDTKCSLVVNAPNRNPSLPRFEGDGGTRRVGHAGRVPRSESDRPAQSSFR